VSAQRDELERRVEQLTAVVSAIRTGSVDGVVVGPSGHEAVYTRTGADRIYRLLVEHLADGVATLAADRTLLYTNRGFAAIVGEPLEQVIGRRLDDFVEDHDRVAGALREAGEGRLGETEIHVRGMGGRPVPVRMSAARMGGTDPVALCVALVDLSGPRRQAEALLDANRALELQAASLTESNRRFRTVFDDGPLAMAIIDPHGRYTSVNRAMCRLTGRDADAIAGQAVGALALQEDRGPCRADFDALLAGDGESRTRDLRYRTPSGDVVWASVTLGAVRAAGGELAFCLEMAQDVTERKQAELRLRHLSEHDMLTGLRNRESFAEAVRHHLRLAERYPVGGALLLVDIDRFKDVNDTLGHQTGDRVLRLVAEVLERGSRACDVVGRLGGDEFALLAPFASPEDVLAMAERLRSMVEEVVVGERRAGTTSVSIGVRQIDGGAQGLEGLLAEADVALYAAKSAGRNRVHVFSAAEGPELTERRLHGAPWVRDVLAREALALWFQPVVDLRTGAVDFYEALLRVGADGGAPQAPEPFLTAAQRAGLMGRVDLWVVDRALAALGEHPGVRLSVNLSAQALQDQGIVGRLVDGLADVRPVRERPVLVELTESLAATRIDEVEATAAVLHGAGCGLALDDFGSGFSSFLHLKHLPIDVLKLDGSFVRDLPASDRDRSIVAAVADLAHRLDQRVVAERVETEPTLRWVRRLGADAVQGFHVGRPAPRPAPVSVPA
jgi:diguanylate cyclase (GGDEF)-like protein/PAS domain S-box-containing protein